MARVVHVPNSLDTDGYPTALLTVTVTAANATDDESFVNTGREIIIFRNSGAGARTVTINSVADPKTGRTGDITAVSIPAGAVRAVGPFNPTGWNQSGQVLHFECEHAEVLISVIRF